MTSLGKTYERNMKFIRFFVNRAPGWAVLKNTKLGAPFWGSNLKLWTWICDRA